MSLRRKGKAASLIFSWKARSLIIKDVAFALYFPIELFWKSYEITSSSHGDGSLSLLRDEIAWGTRTDYKELPGENEVGFLFLYNSIEIPSIEDEDSKLCVRR